ncbi:MAG TPA: hypothetical protein VLA24_17410 [Pseudomonadales bacterium]|nr:hypothetical protein [Pseudomonadales bacterium]
MDEKQPIFEHLEEALAAVGYSHFFRNDLYIRPGQTWSTLEKGIQLTITRLGDGRYSYPLVNDLNRKQGNDALLSS